MPIKATDIKRGQALLWEGQLQVVLGTEFVKPGKGPAYVQAKMKNIETGTIKVNRLNSSDKVDDVTIDRRTMQYLYDSSGRARGFVFGHRDLRPGRDRRHDPGRAEPVEKENVEVVVMMYEAGSISPPVVEPRSPRRLSPRRRRPTSSRGRCRDRGPARCRSSRSGRSSDQPRDRRIHEQGLSLRFRAAKSRSSCSLSGSPGGWSRSCRQIDVTS